MKTTSIVVIAAVLLSSVVLASDPYKKEYDYKPMPFYFDYAVKDDYYYVDFSHDTKSDGKVRTGTYKTLLPDGRTQIVNYKADEYGYDADVKYDGYAKYPEYKPSYPDYKPAYKPSYKSK